MASVYATNPGKISCFDHGCQKRHIQSMNYSEQAYINQHLRRYGRHDGGDNYGGGNENNWWNYDSDDQQTPSDDDGGYYTN
jgi:hypothetical protein